MAQFPFLTSLEISGFRAFSSLRIPRLGSVNLIVGKNNVGKSSVLEALQLYASNGSLSVLGRILESRDEGQIRRSRPDGQILQILPRIFHKPSTDKDALPSLRIGEIGVESQQLLIEIAKYQSKRDDEGHRTYEPLADAVVDSNSSIISGLSIRRNGQGARFFVLDDRLSYRIDDDEDEIGPFHFIGANGLSDSQEVGSLWDQVVLKSAEKDVLSSLKLIMPELQRVVIIDNNNLRRNDRVRIPVGVTGDSDNVTPLRTFGEGMNRLFAIALSLVNSPSGLFLVDEIESGLHYSVQPDLWRLIFDLASRLNTQVFATTHSKDCIDAFQIAASENTSINGRLIRLERRGDQIQSIEFEESELALARDHEIEIR
jgi:hypothetical protein